MEENNDRLTDLQKTGIELWHRAESWKNALLHIQELNTDPLIARYINRALNQENY